MPSPTMQKLTVTTLEDRVVPALFGQTWVTSDSLSVSFAPDGTNVGGVSSNLNATLDGEISHATWKTEIRRAFQTWLSVTNINLHTTGDDGQPFGVAAPIAGLVSRGDIRIAARPLSDNVVIITNPFDLISSWSGEIVINSNKPFNVGGGTSAYDLYSAMLQEVGHAFGVGNSTDPASVMYETYQGPRTGLSAGDVASIKALYGTRTADRFEGSDGNSTIAKADEITFVTSGTSSKIDDSDSKPTMVRGDLTTAYDVDTYMFKTPDTAPGDVKINVRTAERSQLAAKVTLFTASGTVLGSNIASDPGADVNLTVSGLAANTQYYVKVSAANSRFSIGSYTLIAGNNATAMTVSALTPVYQSESGVSTIDTNTHSTIGTAQSLGHARTTGDNRWDAIAYNAAPNYQDAQTVYRIDTTSTTPSSVLVAVWGIGFFATTPRVQLLDSTGTVLAARPLKADGYSQVIQFTGIQTNKSYYLSVTDGISYLNMPHWLAVDFRANPIPFTTFASSTLTSVASDFDRTLTITRSQVFRFEVTAQSLAGQQQNYADLSIRNSAGAVVFTSRTNSGQTISSDVFLSPGTYTVSIHGATTDGSSLGQLGIVGRMTGLTDPIGPTQFDPSAGLLPIPPVAPPDSSPPTTPPPVPVTPPTSTLDDLLNETLGFFFL